MKDEKESRKLPHSYFHLRPLLAFGDLLKLRVKLRQFGGVQAELENTALVIDQHRGLVGDRALDVVAADVIAKDRPCVRIHLFDGSAGEGDEKRIFRNLCDLREILKRHLRL